MAVAGHRDSCALCRCGPQRFRTSRVMQRAGESRRFGATSAAILFCLPTPQAPHRREDATVIEASVRPASARRFTPRQCNSSSRQRRSRDGAKTLEDGMEMEPAPVRREKHCPTPRNFRGAREGRQCVFVRRDQLDGEIRLTRRRRHNVPPPHTFLNRSCDLGSPQPFVAI